MGLPFILSLSKKPESVKFSFIQRSDLCQTLTFVEIDEFSNSRKSISCFWTFKLLRSLRFSKKWVSKQSPSADVAVLYRCKDIIFAVIGEDMSPDITFPQSHDELSCMCCNMTGHHNQIADHCMNPTSLHITFLTWGTTSDCSLSDHSQDVVSNDG